MRNPKSNEIRTKNNIKVGDKVKDARTGVPAARIKGKGDKYDTFTLQEMAVALYGEGTVVLIQTT